MRRAADRRPVNHTRLRYPTNEQQPSVDLHVDQVVSNCGEFVNSCHSVRSVRVVFSILAAAGVEVRNEERITVGATPLVGRVHERQLIESAVNDARGLFFSGPAGVGKTRLLDETKAVLEAYDFDVIEIIGAQATADIPLAPLLGLVDLDQEGDLARLVLSALTRRARNGTVAMLVDDIQRLDDASAALIHRIAAAELALVFATHRSSDPVSPAAESLWKDGLLDRVGVSPMTQASQEMLASLMVGELDANTQQWLWDTAAGHPLFLRELLVDAMLNNRLTPSESGASITPPTGLPPQLIELVGRNVHALDPAARRALELIAVGGSAPVDVISRLAGDDGVRLLLDSRVCNVKDEKFFVSHPLFGETATASLTPDALRRLRVELADAIDAADGDSFQTTLLRLAADEPVDEDALRSAFQTATRSRQPTVIQQLGSALLDQTGDPIVAAQTAMAFAMVRDWDKADALFERAVESASAAQADEIYLMWLDASFEYRGDPAESLEFAGVVVDKTTGRANQIARAMQFRVKELFEPIEPLYRAHGTMLTEELDPRAKELVCLDQSVLSWMMLNIPVVHEMLNDYAMEASLAFTTIRMNQTAHFAQAWSRGIDAALSSNADLRLAYAGSGDADVATSLELVDLIVNAIGLNVGDALTAAFNMTELERRSTERTSKLLGFGYQLFAKSRAKDFTVGSAHLVEMAEKAEPSVYALAGAMICLAASRAARRDGEESEALRQRALDTARWRGDALAELFALRYEFAFGDPATESTVERLTEICQSAGPGLAQLYADEAAAHLAQDGARLAELSLAAEHYGARGLAWDMAAGAQRFLLASGNSSDALRAERRSHRFAALDPNAMSPLYEAMTPVLTEREAEVVELVVEGRSNGEVGEALYLSARTVGRHLERIYRKLDITSRGQLTDIWTSADP